MAAPSPPQAAVPAPASAGQPSRSGRSAEETVVLLRRPPRTPPSPPAGPLLPPIDRGQVQALERVMAELLVAASQNRPKRLSRLAEATLGKSCQGKVRAELLAAAVSLRERCIALGMPACRYRDVDWRLRGLPT